ncbi:hypothetical protein BHM03_00043798 [Ensete ventricosum]|nr:hypothetical protein BHM03_00043798 [Ensete ventricosum]
MLATPNGHKRLRALTTTTVAAEGDMSHDHKGSSSGHVGEKLSLDSEERRGCYVFVALQKKTLAMSKGHERLRAVTATAVATEGDMGFDHRRSTSRHVGEMLSLDSEERRDQDQEVSTDLVTQRGRGRRGHSCRGRATRSCTARAPSNLAGEGERRRVPHPWRRRSPR